MSKEEIYPGVVIGVVKDVDGALGRIKVDFPWLSPEQRSDWASIAAPMAGNGRGTYFMPEIGDEVLVAFLHGRLAHPYVVGFLWNGRDHPPSTDPALRIIHSKNGHKISLYDPPAAAGDMGYVRIEDAHGNMIELRNGMVNIVSQGLLRLQAPAVQINSRVVAPVGPPI